MKEYVKKRKNKKITIIDSVTDSNDNGFEEETKEVEVFKDIWAYYRHMSGKELFSGATRYKVEAIFEINYRKGIKPSMKILYNNEKYYISQIDDFEGKKTDLKIYAYKID